MLIKSQQVESSDALWQQAEVVLSGERLREAVEAEAATLASKARLPGFRPGKVSARAVRQRFGAQLYTETAGRLRAESFQQIADELQLRLAHMPEMSWSHDAAAWPPVGEDLSYQARFELLPEVGRHRLFGAVARSPHGGVDGSRRRLAHRGSCVGAGPIGWTSIARRGSATRSWHRGPPGAMASWSMPTPARSRCP